MIRSGYLFIFIFFITVVFFLVDLTVGSVNIPLSSVWSKESIFSSIFYEIRLPKAFTSLLAGVALSVSGLLMQTLFRNPLAGPSILGISSGATLGVAVYILILSTMGFSLTFVPVYGSIFFAMLGALLMLIVILFASFSVKDSVTLLVVGVITGSLVSSIVAVLQNMSDPESVKHFVNWTLGSLELVSMSQLKFFAPIVILVLLLLLRWVKSLDAFLLGESYAKGLGVSVRSIRIILIFFTAILTGVTTAFVGPIGFVGIVVPHVARMLFNSSKHTIIYPATILLGMLTMLLCDILSQLPDNGYVLPINAVTALVGAPIVLWILFGKGKMVI